LKGEEMKKYSYINLFWSNKVNSPFAELVMFYGENKKHILWLFPACALFGLIELVLIYPLIKLEKIIRRIK
jgi:hypothetical protein